MTRTGDRLQALGQNVEALVRTYAPALKRFFQRRILEHADVDDLVQDVFLRLARRGDLNDVVNPEGYVFQTAANILRDRLRQRFTHQTYNHQPIADSYVEDAAFSPERILLGREAIGRLKGALLELPERTRMVFFLCRIESIPYADVGNRLGISLSSVNKHMARAVEFLIDRMKEES